MRTKTYLPAIIAMLGYSCIIGQPARNTPEMRPLKPKTDARLEIACADCANLQMVEVHGQDLHYSLRFSNEDTWNKILPKLLDIQAGDYTIRYKMLNKPWKTVHLYVAKKNTEKFTIN